MPTSLNLPALRSLGQLADSQPVIVTDSREKLPLPFTNLKNVRGTLQTGDYSVRGLETLYAVERKSVADLVSCCVGGSRARFDRELHRLRGYRFKRLLIVGTECEIEQGCYCSNVKPGAVLGTLAMIEARYDTWLCSNQPQSLPRGSNRAKGVLVRSRDGGNGQ